MKGPEARGAEGPLILLKMAENEKPGFDRNYIVERSIGLLILIAGIVVIIVVTGYLNKPVSGYLIAYIVLALLVFVYFEYKHWSGEFADQTSHTLPASRGEYY